MNPSCPINAPDNPSSAPPPGRSRVKRLFDILVILLSAPAWLLLMIPVAILVRAKLGSPILFRQVRPGYKARPFTIFKFRTMTDARSPDGRLLEDAERLTAFGRWLRSTSLDELPEVFNILRGDMSLVGPRPLLVEFLEHYSPEQARRHDVMPGLTGWAQIHGRNAVNWEDRFKLDVWYVDHRSLLLDLRILLSTVGLVISRHGISAAGEATMPRFVGKSPSKTA